MKRLFGDTSYFIALIAPNDALHERAMALAGEPMIVITSAWVMSELAAYLADPPNRALFTTLLSGMRENPLVEFIEAAAEPFDAGAELYAQRPDKQWSLVDCISFVLMEREGITEALSGDRHFEQAGFKALLLQPDGGG
jgi:predicted nucleic acid-binding protein